MLNTLLVALFISVIGYLIIKSFEGRKSKLPTQEFHEPDKYVSQEQSIIIAYYNNSQRNPYRKKAFDIWYDSIKHLNHRIVEVYEINPELDIDEYPDKDILRLQSDSKVWHKEAILNKIIKSLDPYFKYVFWLDTDVMFTNKYWLTESVRILESGYDILQPFEYCIHLDKDELEPSFSVEAMRNKIDAGELELPYKKMWRSFCSNYTDRWSFVESTKYDIHGHVGFAWGARRDVLDKVLLYDKALIGGADHIIAHAAAGQIPHECITKSFGDTPEIINWMREFNKAIEEVCYTDGDLYHIWHGDIEKREYLKRIIEFNDHTKSAEKDESGLYKVSPQAQTYYEDYINRREDTSPQQDELLVNIMLDATSDSTTFEPIETAQEAPSTEWSGFGNGGDFGGGGAGGSWTEEAPAYTQVELSAQADLTNENFS